MLTGDIQLLSFAPTHLDGALALSRQVNWPHRREDWQMMLGLSEGIVAIDDRGVVAGTVLLTPFGADCATINMVIVDAALRGRGFGRKLMEGAIAMAGERPLRLVATSDGLPLYEKFGFVASGTILQHQGSACTIPAPEHVEPATPGDLAAIRALDRAAFGADRTRLIDILESNGQLAVIRRDGAVVAYAALRAFGRGEVIGPVIAANADDARALIAHFAAPRAGSFLRIDTTDRAGLSDFLETLGLAHVGGGIAMNRPAVKPPASTGTQIFGLASQALG